MNDGSRLCTTLTAAAMLVLAASVDIAHAQGLYRIVGPDGRVTYSDHPPPAVSQSGRVDVMRAPGGAAQGAVGYTRAEAAPASGGARTASNGGPGSHEAALEEAVIGVLGMEDAVRRTETICVSMHPSAARRYSGAVDDWARRNARTVLVARRVLTREFDVPTRERIEAGVREHNAVRFDAVRDAPDARRIAWCDRSVAEMAAGQMDVHDRPKLAGPLARLPSR